MKTLTALAPSRSSRFVRQVGTWYCAPLADFLAFLRRPTPDARLVELSNGEKTRRTLLLWTIHFPLALALATLVSFLKARGILPAAPPQEFDWMKNPLSAFGLLVVAAPLLEEALFRSWLHRAHLLLALLFLAGGEGGVYLAAQEAGRAYVPLVFTLLALPVLALGRWLGRRYVRRFEAWIAPGYRRLFPIVFYGVSVLAFGLVHAANYHLDAVPFWMYAVLCLPQLVAGTFLGYTRLRYGLGFAFLFHAVHNFACWVMEFSG
jgi:membrane protease YdiL (CAAX protease family)